MSEASKAIVAQLSLHEKCELCGQNGGYFERIEASQDVSIRFSYLVKTLWSIRA